MVAKPEKMVQVLSKQIVPGIRQPWRGFGLVLATKSPSLAKVTWTKAAPFHLQTAAIRPEAAG